MPDISPDETNLIKLRELEREVARRKAKLGLDRPDVISDHPSEMPNASFQAPERSFQAPPAPPRQAPYSPGWTEAARAPWREEAKDLHVEKENQVEAAFGAVQAATSGSLANIDEHREAEVLKDAQAIKVMDEETRIKTLLALAWQKGISYSIAVAKKLDDPYTLDLLHARLEEEHDKFVGAKKLDDL